MEIQTEIRSIDVPGFATPLWRVHNLDNRGDVLFSADTKSECEDFLLGFYGIERGPGVGQIPHHIGDMARLRFQENARD